MRKFQYLFLGIAVICVLIVGFFVFTPRSVQTNKIEPYVRIESGRNTKTNTRFVDLYLLGPKNVEKMMVSNHPNFKNADWERYKTKKEWVLDYGRGTKRVYVKFKKKNGDTSQIYRDSTLLQIPTSMDVGVDIEEGAEKTKTRYVTLSFNYSPGVELVKVSNSKDFSDIKWRKISNKFFWPITSGKGEKVVYVKFKDANNKTKVVKDKINYTAPPNEIGSGTVLATVDKGVYYYGYDGFLHRFLNSAVYHSWFRNFDNVEMVSQKKISELVIDSPVCIKAGTWLIKFSQGSQVYAVEPGCRLRPIHSPVEAFILYGSDWGKRIMEIPSALANDYKKNNPWHDGGVKDNDQDGVPSSVEDDYQSSEKSKDTDSDSLSDYEEIYFWFTDPTNPDSDGDGIKDGVEIIQGQSPLGPGKVKRIPQDTYEFPKGSVVRGVGSGDYYYKNRKGNYDYLSDSKDSEIFTSNQFQERFTIDPVFNIELTPKSGETLQEGESLIWQPTTRGASDNLMKL